MENNKNKFTGKIFILGKIKVLTGLHIGGSKSDLDIGGVDLSVIKTPDNKRLPFIPGSSFKGKLRTMLAREEGSQQVKDDSELIKEIFGYAADNSDTPTLPTRLIVRDALLDDEKFVKDFERENLDTTFTMVKWENTINRKTGTAEHPRQIERVPAGAEFPFSMVYNCFDDEKEKIHLQAILKAMRLLEDDYIGGQGSRGYGQITFEEVRLKKRSLKAYAEGKEAQDYTELSW